MYRFVLYDSGTLSVIVSVPCDSPAFVDIYRMEATVMSDEIERERESTRPKRENPTLSVPAFRKVTCARPPRARDLTGSASAANRGRAVDLTKKCFPWLREIVTRSL